MTGPAELPGLDAGKRAPRTWEIEITPMPPGQTSPETVRVTLVDREHGRRVGATTVPWQWFRDCARSTVLVSIGEGVWS